MRFFTFFFVLFSLIEGYSCIIPSMIDQRKRWSETFDERIKVFSQSFRRGRKKVRKGDQDHCGSYIIDMQGHSTWFIEVVSLTLKVVFLVHIV